MSVSAPAVSTLHLHNISGMGPADVPHEGGDDEVRADEATLSPGTQKCGQKDQQMSSKKLDKFFFPWRECTEIPPVRQFLPLEG